MSGQSRMHRIEARRKRCTGFGLVEIMVGLLIGLLATLAVMQVYSTFEGQKRGTTGTADAQTGGSMALYAMKRDVEMAGYGIPVFSAANSPLRCTTVPSFDHDGNAATPAIDIFPAVITDGGAGSDSLSIRFGRTDTAGIPVRFSLSGGTDAIVANNLGCQAGDWAVISNGANCAMIKVSESVIDLPPPATRTDWGRVQLAGAPDIASGSIACLGRYQKDPPFDDHSSPLEYLYWIDNGQLVMGGDPATPNSGVVVMADIVSIQAQYGVSASPGDNRITQWVDATGADWSATGTNWITSRNRIKAIRIAVVARNGQLEKTDVTSACSSLTAATPTGLCTWDATSAAPGVASPAPAIDLSADTEWRRHRYRVFETIVPLRSMIWSKERL